MEFNLRELTDQTETTANKKKAVTAEQQFANKFGVGDTVTVVVSRTDEENKVSTLPLQTYDYVNLKMLVYETFFRFLQVKFLMVHIICATSSHH